jgi:hypothetical protein
MQSVQAIGWGLLLASALLAFKVLPPRTAALAVFFGGWLFAPVGVFPTGSSQAGQTGHPFWILGSALPSDMLLHKAWVVPCAVLLGTLLFDRQSLRRFRPSWFDMPLLLWCTWPLLQSLLWVGEPRPAGAVASLYLFGTWGLTWFIGRMYCGGADGWSALARALAWAGLACLPFALAEGLAGAQTYGWFFEPHPFRHDGDERYLGWRPLGFFENGNQYGLWISLCALVAAWLAWCRDAIDRRWRVVAGAVLAMALAAQSIGGLMLAALGALVLWLSSRLRPRAMVAAALAAAVTVGAVYVSGVVPVARIANETTLGRAVVGAIKSVGRGSFTWRIAQDQRALPLATAQPLAGTGQWDWWRTQPSRPWGLAMLVLGQFGLVGVALSASVLLLPAARIAWTAPRGDARSPQALPWLLAIVVLLSMLDAVLNSFVFFPAVLIAAALSTHER